MFVYIWPLHPKHNGASQIKIGVVAPESLKLCIRWRKADMLHPLAALSQRDRAFCTHLIGDQTDCSVDLGPAAMTKISCPFPESNQTKIPWSPNYLSSHNTDLAIQAPIVSLGVALCNINACRLLIWCLSYSPAGRSTIRHHPRSLVVISSVHMLYWVNGPGTTAGPWLSLLWFKNSI